MVSHVLYSTRVELLLASGRALALRGSQPRGSRRADAHPLAEGSFLNALRIILVCAVLVASPEVSATEPLTGREVLTRVCETVDSVQALHFKTVTYSAPWFSEVLLSHPVIEKNSNGKVLERAEERWWDARNLNRCKCRELTIKRNRDPFYDDYEYTLDGELYRGVSKTDLVARISPQAVMQGSAPSPLFLLGHEMLQLPIHLTKAILQTGRIENATTTHPDGLIEVTSFYQPPDGSYELKVQIWADPEKEYFPMRILTTFLQTKSTDTDIRTTRVELISGVYVPLEGSRQMYYIQEHLPDGLTSGEVNAMPKQQMEEILSRTVYEAVPLGELNVVNFQAADVEVNDLKPLEFFRLPFPDDERYEVLDFSGRETVTKPATDEPHQNPVIELPQSAAVDSPGRFGLLYALLSVNGVLVCVWLGMRFNRWRLKRRHAQEQA